MNLFNLPEKLFGNYNSKKESFVNVTRSDGTIEIDPKGKSLYGYILEKGPIESKDTFQNKDIY